MTIAMRTGSTLQYLHTDHLGGVAAVTDSAGVYSTNQSYFAYGKKRAGGTLPTTINYTGQRLDGSGLVYMNARYYDPLVGMFISPDTIVPDAGNLVAYNRFMYVAGNPLRLKDGSGHFWETALDVASIGYDIYDIYNNGLTWSSAGSLVVDVGGALVPFVPAPGACIRWCDDALQYSDEAVEYGGKAANWVGDKVDEGWDATKKFFNNNPCTNSFSADTLVMTAAGSKPIAELVVGDIVLAYHEATGEIGPYPVTDTMVHLDPAVIELTIDGELIETTPEHPFYVMESAPWLAEGQTAGRWVDAGELTLNDLIWQADGTTGRVQSVTIVPVEQWMYNLTVGVAHTFFVGDGGWLVHNAGPCGFRSRPFAQNNALNENMIQEMFRGKWVDAQWLPDDGYQGGLAGAIRREIATGELVGGKSHLTKGIDRLNGLKRILTTGKFSGQDLVGSDLDLVRNLHDDLLNAMQGK